jgi:hypothetical protein
MSEARKRRYSTITDFVSSNTGIADRTRGSATIQVTPTLPIPERVNHILSEDAIALAVRVILKLTAEKEAGHVVGTSGVIERANDYLGIGETKLKELRKTYIAVRGRVLPPSYIQREPREMRGRISNDWFGRIREEISRIRLTVGKPVEIPDILKWFHDTHNMIVTRKEVYYALKKMGFLFGKTKKLILRRESDRRRLQENLLVLVQSHNCEHISRQLSGNTEQLRRQ